MGSTDDSELPLAVGLSAGRADGQRMELCAATVLEDDRLGTWVDVAVAPLLVGEQERLGGRARLPGQGLVARGAGGGKGAPDPPPIPPLSGTRGGRHPWGARGLTHIP